MANRFPISGMVVWGAWVLAGIVGSVLPVLGATFGWLGPVYEVGDLWIVVVVNSAIVAFPQFIVLRLLIGHSSLATAMWIPVSVVAWLAGYIVLSTSADSTAYSLLSVGAVRALIPGRFPFLTVITGIESIVLAAALGLAQGFLVGRMFFARSAVWLWLVGNLAAAVIVWIIVQVRTNSVSNQTNQTAVDVLLPTAIFGALYAGITGIALVALSRRYVDARPADRDVSALEPLKLG